MIGVAEDRWAPDVKPILELHLCDELPTQWQRGRGTRHYKHEALRAWQEHLADVAREEIAMCDHPEKFPLKRCSVSLLLLYPDMAALEKAPDPDNLIKGCLDALLKIVWVDDRGRYLRGIRCFLDVARAEEVGGTHLVVYAI